MNPSPQSRLLGKSPIDLRPRNRKNFGNLLGRSAVRALFTPLACLAVLGSAAQAQESLVESAPFLLDLRPPGINPDAISIAELDWFELDLTGGISTQETGWFVLDLDDSETITQAVSLSADFPPLMGGVIGDALQDLKAKVDFTALGLDPIGQYYAEVQLAPHSTTLYPKFGGLTQNDAWRIAVDAANSQLLLNNESLVGLKTFTASSDSQGSWPAITEYDYPWALSEWPAARYTYTLYRSLPDSDDAFVAEGSFRLGQIKPRHTTPHTSKPVLLVHGLASSADFFADETLIQDADPDNDFSAIESLGGALAATNPTYTLEVPNIDDIAESASLLKNALSYITESQKSNGVDVIGHNMGGVVTRYADQFLLGSESTLLGRIVSLGAPFEGPLHKDYASGGLRELLYFSAPSHLMAASLSNASRLNFSPADAADSIAVKQLSDPQAELNALWDNAAAGVTSDTEFLAIAGTTPYNLQLAPEAFAKGMENPAFARQLSTALNLQSEMIIKNLFVTKSDGLVSWRSGGKRDAAEPNNQKNIYVAANQTGYNLAANSNRAGMIEAIANFLDLGLGDPLEHPLYTTEPLSSINGLLSITDNTPKTVRISNDLNKAVSNAVIAVLDETANMATLISTLSNKSGELIIPSKIQIPDENARLIVLAKGYQMDFTGSLSSGSNNSQPLGEVSLPEALSLTPTPGYTGPLDTYVSINRGQATTQSLNVSLSLSARNATEMSIGAGSDGLDWQPYAKEIKYTFKNADPGEKLIHVSFRNAASTVGAVATDSILYVPADEATGTLAVTDFVGGASIVLNGEPISVKSPTSLENLPIGSYTIILYKKGVTYGAPSRTVEVVESAQATVEYQRTAETADPLYVAWLAQHFTEQQLADATVSSETADPDHDLKSNYFEFLAQLDPNVPNALLDISYVGDSRETLRISPKRTGIAYEVQYSEDLEAWNAISPSLVQTVDGGVEVDLSSLPEESYHRIIISSEAAVPAQ